MPVIGRLDDQVEAVLINPLKGRRAPDESARERPPATSPPALPAAPDSEERRGAHPVPNKRDDDDPALPVWLL